MLERNLNLPLSLQLANLNSTIKGGKLKAERTNDFIKNAYSCELKN